MIQYICPNCHTTLESPTSLAGQADVCPKCQHSTTVPQAATTVPRAARRIPWLAIGVYVGGSVLVLAVIIAVVMWTRMDDFNKPNELARGSGVSRIDPDEGAKRRSALPPETKGIPARTPKPKTPAARAKSKPKTPAPKSLWGAHVKSVKVSTEYTEKDLFGGGDRYSIVATDKGRTLAIVEIRFKAPGKPVESQAAAVKTIASHLIVGESNYLLKPLPKPGVMLSSSNVRLKPRGQAEIPAVCIEIFPVWSGAECDDEVLHIRNFTVTSGGPLSVMRYLRNKRGLTVLWVEPGTSLQLTFIFPIPVGLKKAELKFYDVEPITIDLPQ